jgi:hypothetical protein
VIKDYPDTRKLENNLKSLSKFYDTLNKYNDIENNDASNSNENANIMKTSLTMQSLIEMAKEVSDQMTINKVQVIKLD